MPIGTDEILKAADRIRSGGVVAFPTETVYGLGADAFNPQAVARVFALKGRPSNNPLIVHVSGPEMASRVVAPGAFGDDALLLTRAIWPGPLSLVLPKTPDLPEIVTAGGPNVAVRCPDHPVTLALLLALGTPLVGPSANLSGRISPTTAAHVRESFDPHEVPVLDGGPCTGGIESTVLSLVGGHARLLRQGLVSPEQIAEILGRPVDVSPPPKNSGEPAAPLASPGLLDRHYAPSTPTLLLHRDSIEHELNTQPWLSTVALLLSRPEGTLPTHTLLMPSIDEEYAAVIYAALHQADALGVERILIERPPSSSPVWRAVIDRLTRASQPE